MITPKGADPYKISQESLTFLRSECLTVMSARLASQLLLLVENYFNPQQLFWSSGPLVFMSLILYSFFLRMNEMFVCVCNGYLDAILMADNPNGKVMAGHERAEAASCVVPAGLKRISVNQLSEK